jgi:hypothetical protein
MVHALYLALRLFISGYFAPSLIHAGDSQAETPWTSCERDRLPHSEEHSGEHSGGGSPAQTAHTVATPLTFNKRGNGQQLPPDNSRDDDEREQPMTFTVSQVNAWRAELAAMPAPDPTTRAVGKRAALEMMAKELQALCRRGYTTAELLELLATKGLHTHEETLRAVLRTARPSGPRATTRPRPSQSPTDSSSSAAGQIGQEEDRRADSNGTVTPTAEEPPPGQNQTQAQAAGPTVTSKPLANRPDTMAAQAATARKTDAAPAASARLKAGPQVGMPAMPSDEIRSDPSGVASDAKDRQPGVIREDLRGFGQPGGVDVHRHNRAGSQDTPAGPARPSPASRGTFTPRKDSDQL